MGFFDKIGSFISDNAGDILSGVGSVLGTINQGSARDKAYDVARGAEDRRYQDYLNEYNYYKDYTTNDYNQRVAQAGASAAASNLNNQRRMEALQAAFGDWKRQNRRQQNLWKPYAQAGRRILPQMEQLYGNSARGMNLLSAYMNTPEYFQQMNMQTPASQVEIPLPDHLRNKQ